MSVNRLASFPGARDASFRLQTVITSSGHILATFSSLPGLHLPRLDGSYHFRRLGIDWHRLRERATPHAWESIGAVPGCARRLAPAPEHHHLLLLPFIWCPCR
ncbi:hypothetical protein BDZ89DRAFT_1075382 [Hymenopellis radicata]|nr:hypothetical protein BDZ89DRAFT_1075382 [Hymenopellis radicata]